jgi:hypothetical protein
MMFYHTIYTLEAQKIAAQENTCYLLQVQWLSGHPGRDFAPSEGGNCNAMASL